MSPSVQLQQGLMLELPGRGVKQEEVQVQHSSHTEDPEPHLPRAVENSQRQEREIRLREGGLCRFEQRPELQRNLLAAPEAH